MAYTLFSSRRAGSVTAECLLAEAGAEVRVVDVDIKSEKQLAPEYREINPMGRIPALVLPDGTLMTESAAIVLAIAELHPECNFLPPMATKERFELYRWLMFVSNNIYEAVGREDYPARYSTDPSHAPAIKQRAIEDSHRFWAMVERDLTPSPHAIGGRFTALDVYMANLSQWVDPRDWIARECPRVANLANIVRARAKMTSIWDRHFPPAAG